MTASERERRGPGSSITVDTGFVSLLRRAACPEAVRRRRSQASCARRGRVLAPAAGALGEAELGPLVVLEPVRVGHAAVDGEVGGETDGLPGTGRTPVCWLARGSHTCPQARLGTPGGAGRGVPGSAHALSRVDRLLEPFVPGRGAHCRARFCCARAERRRTGQASAGRLWEPGCGCRAVFPWLWHPGHSISFRWQRGWWTLANEFWHLTTVSSARGRSPAPPGWGGLRGTRVHGRALPGEGGRGRRGPRSSPGRGPHRGWCEVIAVRSHSRSRTGIGVREPTCPLGAASIWPRGKLALAGVFRLLLPRQGLLTSWEAPEDVWPRRREQLPAGVASTGPGVEKQSEAAAPRVSRRRGGLSGHLPSQQHVRRLV